MAAESTGILGGVLGGIGGLIGQANKKSASKAAQQQLLQNLIEQMQLGEQNRTNTDSIAGRNLASQQDYGGQNIDLQRSGASRNEELQRSIAARNQDFIRGNSDRLEAVARQGAGDNLDFQKQIADANYENADTTGNRDTELQALIGALNQQIARRTGQRNERLQGDVGRAEIATTRGANQRAEGALRNVNRDVAPVQRAYDGPTPDAVNQGELEASLVTNAEAGRREYERTLKDTIGRQALRTNSPEALQGLVRELGTGVADRFTHDITDAKLKAITTAQAANNARRGIDIQDRAAKDAESNTIFNQSRALAGDRDSAAQALANLITSGGAREVAALGDYGNRSGAAIRDTGDRTTGANTDLAARVSGAIRSAGAGRSGALTDAGNRVGGAIAGGSDRLYKAIGDAGNQYSGAITDEGNRVGTAITGGNLAQGQSLTSLMAAISGVLNPQMQTEATSFNTQGALMNSGSQALGRTTAAGYTDPSDAFKSFGGSLDKLVKGLDLSDLGGTTAAQKANKLTVF